MQAAWESWDYTPGEPAQGPTLLPREKEPIHRTAFAPGFYNSVYSLKGALKYNQKKGRHCLESPVSGGKGREQMFSALLHVSLRCLLVQ